MESNFKVTGPRVAILIPTMNRSDFVREQLKYYSSNSFEHPILIGDSSTIIQHKKTLKEIVDNYSNKLDLSLYFLPNKNNREVNYFLASETKEKFCAFIGDDDYILSEGLKMAASYLEKNEDYRTAQGSALIFTRTDKKFDFGWGWYWKNVESNKELARDRFYEHSRNYWVPIFSVHRTDEFIDDINHNECADKSFNYELIQSFSMITRGKSKFLEEPFMIRQGHSGTLKTNSGINWITDKDWFSSYELFCKVIASSISKIDKFPLEKSLEFVKESFNNGYITYSLRKPYDTNNSKISIFYIFLKRVIFKLCKKLGIEKKLRDIFFKKKFGKKWVVYINSIESNYKSF